MEHDSPLPAPCKDPAAHLAADTVLTTVVGRFAVLVDVGYLYAAAADALRLGVDRKHLKVDTADLIRAIIERAQGELGGQLLRVYWFDGARNKIPTVEQRAVARQPNVKVLLGNVNAYGQQKGVDFLLGDNLMRLARHQAITDAVVVAGDEDIVGAVTAAQSHGVRVHLWGVQPHHGANQAEQLVWESDTIGELEPAFLEPFFTRADPPPMPPPPPQLSTDPATGTGQGRGEPPPGGAAAGAGPAAPTQGVVPTPAAVAPRRQPPPPEEGIDPERAYQVGEHVAHKWFHERGRDFMADLLPGKELPPVIDQELLVAAEKELNESLRPYNQARIQVREGFWDRVYREFGCRC
jgi:uncharacterized LabA/DUF88 family protein